MTQTVFGVDIAKSWIDVAGPEGHRRIENAGLDGFAEDVAVAGGCVVFESCGAYERPLRTALARRGVPAYRVNPSRARALAQGLGILAKTDKLDARVLRRMGEMRAQANLAETAPEPENLSRLRALRTRRRQLVDMRADEKRRQPQAGDPWVQAEIAQHITALSEQIAHLDSLLAEAVRADPELCAKATLLGTAPGVGPVLTTALLAEMPELGSLTAKAAGALTGTAPIARESGQRLGTRCIAGGRKHVRDTLFMAALSACRANPDLAAFARRLKENGKAHKQIMIAVARKLIVMLNAMIRDKQPFTSAK